MDEKHEKILCLAELCAITASSFDGFLLVDMAGNIRETNDSYCQMIGYSREELLGMHISSVDAIESREDVANRVKSVIRLGSLRFETNHRHKDGHLLDIEASVTYSTDYGGTCISFFRDLTRENRTKNIMNVRLRLMKYSLNHSMAELLSETLDEAEILTGSCIGYYHLVDSDNELISLQAWSTNTYKKFCNTGAIDSHYHISQAGVWADCVRERRPVIHNDYATLPHRKGMPEGHVTVIRELAVPVFRNEKIVAVFGVGNKLTDYSQQDVEVITLLADLAWDVAECKLAEEAVRKSEERHKAILQTAFDGFWRTDMQGQILEVNDAYCKMSGYSPQELLGMKVTVLDVDFDCNSVADTNEQVMSVGEGRFESRHQRKDGTVYDVEVRVKYQSTESKCFVAFIRDITIDKQANDALKKSEHFFKESQRVAFIGSYYADFIAGIWESSEVLDAIFGIDLNYVRSIQGWLDIIHPDDRDLMDRYLMEEVIGNKKPFSMDYRIIRRNDGETRWVNGQGLAEFDIDGNMLSLIGTIQDVTDKKYLEQSLGESEDRLRNYVAFSPHGVFVTDENGRFIDANPAASHITGYTKEELLTMNIPDLLPLESLEWGYRTFNTLLETGRSSGEAAHRKKNGEIGYCSLEAVKLSSSGYMAIITDITDRKRAEDELNSTSQRLYLATTSAGLGVWDWNVQTNQLVWDDRMFELYGVTPEEFPNTVDVWINSLHPEDKDSAIAESQTALIGDKRYNTSFRICHPDGNVKYIRAIGIVIRGIDGKAERMLGINSDITDHKLADIDNSRYLSRQRAILDNMPMMAWLKDTDGRYEMVNEPFAIASGYSVTECIGKTDADFWPEDIARAYMADDREVCESGLKKHVEEAIPTPDGEKWHLTYRTPIFDEQGLVIGTTGITEDITSQKESEKQRTKLENELLQAQKMESIGRLAGGVAHDFNNMLSVILGHAELGLMRIDPTNPLYAGLTEIRKSAERSADLTRQLLAFARKQTIAPKVIDLNKTVTDVLNMLHRLIGEDINLIWKPSATLWPVLMDSSQIDQILANLCVNSRDAIADIGQITIETGNCSIDEMSPVSKAYVMSGDYVCLTVSDNGTGMDEEILTHIFEPFYTTKEMGKGTGLGLATVYGAIKQNNGFIDVSSEQGVGTTFKIYLPRHKDKAGKAQGESVVESPPKGHETILLVEDEPAILNIATMILVNHGYNVLAADTPGKALQLARKHTGEIHLIMTDVVMPEMNGRDLAKKVLSLYPRIKRIFMSGYTADVIAHEGVLDEGVHFIQKPFNVSTLAEKLREVLDN
jgi:PAS domain S-box-containing protein